MAYVISDECLSCGACAAQCPAEAISMGDLHYEIDPDKCRGCTLCAKKCPVSAISGALKTAHTIDSAACIKCGACKSSCKFGAVIVE